MRILAGLVFCVIADAQAFTCAYPAGSPTILRLEGISELLEDIVLICKGGTPTPAGQLVPTVNFTVTSSAPVTNARTAEGATDALLLIDEPNTPSATLGRTPPINFVAAPLTPGGPPSVVGVGSGPPSQVGSVYDGKETHGNAFQGRVQGSNSVIWNAPFDPPGLGLTRTFRITNLRVNAAAVGASGQVQVKLDFQQTTGANLAVSIPDQANILATVQPGLATAGTG